MTTKEVEQRYMCIVIGLVLIFMGIMVGLVINVKKCDTSSPVEEIDNIKHLTNSADSIKLIIINLDSAKRDEIQRVQTLDNDSSLKLFYELLRR